MNTVIVYNLINEEINRNVRLEMILTKDEMRAMRRLEMRTSHLNEELDWGIVKDITIAALKTRAGRRLAMALLKALHFVLDMPNTAMKEITVPMWQSAIDFLRSKGLKVPFDAADLYKFIRYTPPFTFLLGKPVEWAIDFLKELNDDQYLEMVGQKDREGLTRGSNLHEGFFDSVKGFFGGGKSREEEAAAHFTTENPIWPKMQVKLRKDRGTRTSVRKNLGALGGIGNKEAYDKYIPSEWQKSREDIEIYRNAMREAMLKYIDETHAGEEAEREKSRRESESKEQEREAAKRWLYDRDIVDKVMGHFGMQSNLRNQTTNLCFQIYLTYFRNGIKNPYSDDIIDDAVQLIDDSKETYTSRVDDRVLARALARAQSLNPKR